MSGPGESTGAGDRATAAGAGATLAAEPTVVKPPTQFFPCFDGLRALGVISVIASHVGFITGATAQQRGGDYLAHLDFAPAMFFFISAFLLYRPFCAAAFAGKAPLATRIFWWRRLLRVFPAYWIALTVLIVFFGLHVSGWRDYVVYYPLLQVYSTRRFLGGIPQAYTLCIEFAFYVIVPGYAWMLRSLARGRDDKQRLQVEVAVAAVLVAICFTYRHFVYVIYGRTSVGRIAIRWLPGYLDAFAVGMALAAVSVYVAAHGANRLVDIVGRLSWLWWGIALFCFWLVAKHIGLVRSPQPQNTPIGWQADEQEILQTAIAALVALPAIFGPQGRGLIRRFLQWRPIVFMGLVSYGLYLWQEGWLNKWLVWLNRPNFVQLIVAHAQIARSTYPLIFVLTVLSSLVTAAASYYLIDKPVLALKNRVPRFFGGPGMRR